MVDLNPFSQVIQCLTESAVDAENSWSEVGRENILFEEWGVYAIGCILEKVQDPLTRLQVLSHAITNTFADNADKTYHPKSEKEGDKVKFQIQKNKNTFFKSLTQLMEIYMRKNS